MNIKRFIALAVAIIMAVSCLPFAVFAVTEDDFYELDYLFIGDEAKVAGYAQGIITVTPNSTGAKSGYYLIYYTDGLKVLPGYDELASAKITGEPVRIEVKDGTMIPEGAKGIAVFESTTKFLDNAPDLSTAKARRIIPEHKRLTLSTPELVFGLASDVHMNYEGTNPSRGAFKKWETALKFFKQNGATYVMVSGDMTGDRSDSNSMGANFTLEKQYQKYSELITAAGYSKDTVFETIGNHGNINADINLYLNYTSGSNEVRPYAGAPYFYVMLAGKNGAKNNLIISMRQELDPDNVGGYLAGNSAKIDNFSKEQIDWLEGLLQTYGNRADTNIFILEHSPFRNYGAGEKYNGVYSGVVTFKSEFTQNMRLKALLETYTDVTVFSGHTHETLYDGLNYSDMANTFANTVHVPSTCWPRAYYDDGVSSADGRDGRKTCDANYGSEAYIVKVYADYVVYTGYNLSTGKIIPAGCIIIPTKSYTPTPEDAFEGSGTASDPYLIQNESDFLVFTNGINLADKETAKYGDGKYFKQTADINMIGIESYLGTHANGNARRYFGGNYDGNGYTIKVAIKGPEQRSVFPYIYGTISNVVIRGDIVSDTAVQPVRANRGKIINCVFDCYLQAENASGMVYSNYSYVYNVYATGYMQGTNNYAVAMNNDSAATVKNVYHYFNNSGGAVTNGAIGTRSNDYTQIANVFNLRSGSDYNTAASYISPAFMSKAGVTLGKFNLGHDGNAPAAAEIPTKGNIAPYGSYTLSQLYRQGDASNDWAWDETKPISYPDENGTSLTDGKLAAAAKYSDAAWVGFHAKTPDYISNGYSSIKFDYTKAVNVKTVNLYVGNTDMGGGISAPSKVMLYCDGRLVSTVTPTNVTTETGIGTEKVILHGEVAAKSIEIRMEGYGWIFVSEVEIITGDLAPHVCVGSGDWLSDANNHWKKCDCGEKAEVSKHDNGSWKVTTPAQVGVKGEKELRCTVCNYLIKTEAIPALTPEHTHSPENSSWQSNESKHWKECACGDKLNESIHNSGKWVTVKEAEFGIDGSKELRCTVCGYVLDSEPIPALKEEEPKPDYTIGDVNGNGKIDARDYLLLKRAYFGTYTLTCDLEVSDINGNGKIDARDYLLLKRAYFGTYTIG